MTQIPAPSPATVPDVIVATPGEPRVECPGASPIPPKTGPLRSGNPRGNPNLAPRCGAKARRTGCACRAPAMANGRCRMHGGRCTGPQPVRFAKRGQDPTHHHVVGWRRDRAPGRPARAPAPGGRCDPRASVKTLCNVARWGWRRDCKRGRPARAPAPGGRRNSRISVKTLCTVVRWGWWRDRKRGRPAGDLAAGGRRNSQIADKTLCNVARWGWRQGRTPGTPVRDLAAGGRRNSQIADKTLCNVTRWGWRRDRTPGRPARDAAPGGRRGPSAKTLCNVARWGGRGAERRGGRPGLWLRAAGAIRETRSRPYATSGGGVGGGTEREGGRPGTRLRAGGAVRRTRTRPYATGDGHAPNRAGWGGRRRSRQKPHATGRGGDRGEEGSRGWPAPDLRRGQAPPVLGRLFGPTRGPAMTGPMQSLSPGACPGGGAVRSGAGPFRWGCWAAPPPTTWRCTSWRRGSKPPANGRR